ncbi:MAG: hypothetical protein HGA65_16540 [Oscillochloris sp.]|nr:hypothetical protein [Oscillochloris sp.]
MTAQQLTPPQGCTTRPNLTRLNARVDLALGGLLLGTGFSAYLDTTIHIALASALLVGVGVHLALHGRWIAATARRRHQAPWATQRKALLGLLLLLILMPLVLSGAVVALIYAPSVSVFHTRSFYLFAGLALLHLALSWRWIAARLRRRESSSVGHNGQLT